MLYPVGENTGIYCIEGIGPARAYLVMEPVPLLVDSGAPGQADRIIRDLASLGVRPIDVRYLLVTHHHEDHAGGLFELKKRSGAKILAHPRDVEYIQGRRTRRPPRNPIGRVYHSAVNMFTVEYKPVEVDKPLNDGQEVLGLRVIHTPGHTPGHLCLLRGDVLFSGDLVEAAAGGFTETPPANTADVPTSRESIRKVSEYDFQAILSGHRPPYVSSADRRVRELARKLGGVVPDDE